MRSNKAFQIALFISLIAHGAVLLQNPQQYTPRADNKQRLEVSYIKNQPEGKITQKNSSPTREPLLKLPPKITAKITPVPFIDRNEIFKNNKSAVSLGPSFTKPTLIRPEIPGIKKKVTLPPVDISKSNNPSYLSYYQIVREKIRRCAYQNYMRQETGEVYISFIVSSAGPLKELKLTEEKSSPNPYLREIALRSVKDASPFPNFPKELDYPNLSFNVVISFEIE